MPPWVRLGEGWGGDSRGDACELAHVAAGELDPAEVGTRACEVFYNVRVEVDSACGTGIYAGLDKA